MSDTLIKQRSDLQAEGLGITAAAREAGRQLTADEVKTLDDRLAKIEAIDAKLDAAKAAEEAVTRFEALGALPQQSDGVKADRQAATLGEHFVKSVGADRVKAFPQTGGTLTAPEWNGPRKAATDTHMTTEHDALLLTDIDRTPVRDYRQQPLIADLLGTGTVSGNAIKYAKEGAFSSGTATVAEGAQKPQSHLEPWTWATDSITKLATWFDVTDEMFEDLPYIVSEMNNRGLYDLAMKEEAQLLSGDGNAPNLLGLLNRSGIQTETSTAQNADHPDAIFRAAMKVSTATGMSADGLIINPVDYQALRLMKDANNQYYGGGFFAGQYGTNGVPMQPPVWGLRTIVSPVAAAGAPVVGAFRQSATVYRKGGVRVEATNSDGNKFTKNIRTILIEERIGLAVRRPGGIVKLTLTPQP